ncbi:hypothetical protein ACM26V_05335 [Salipaludibacillus sp. HK11]|uniref:hypothetical protein n=1 Tax=Salipaludibacillus sp. HK11 TaxID=3394320 RepID=UPI0039FD1FB7
MLISTGKFIGEEFDYARLDMLFLTMPISWKGTLQHYVGRLHRDHDGKREVRVYDYVDEKNETLKNMYQNRLKGYHSLGYSTEAISGVMTEQLRLFE